MALKKFDTQKFKKFVLPAVWTTALSACGSAGLYCLYIWYILVANGEAGISPIDYRASIIVGILMVFACVMLALFYVISRHKNFTIRGVLIDLGCLVVTFVPFLFLWSRLYHLISNLI
ncbi:MAG: hypothetical protein IJD09_02660 [Clostridia bacterium]|nr:hypothetical protein [Clostridia bacterium]